MFSTRDVWASARCAEVDPELFFPEGGDRAEQAGAAKAVCARCPVKAACLALFGDLPYGVIGGMTADERRRQRAAAHHGESGVAA